MGDGLEVTIDLETCKIIVHIGKLSDYAIFISKWDGRSITMTIPQLIDELKKVRDEKKNKALEEIQKLS